MADYSAEEAKKRYEALPLEIKNLLYSPEMSFAIQQVGQKNHLHIDQIDTLNTEAGQVMLGFVESNNFVNELVEMLSVDQAKARAVAQDVDEMLFSKIREAMKKVYEANKVAPAVVSATPTPPPPASTSTAPMNPSSKLPPLEPRSTPPMAPMTPPMVPMSAPKPASIPTPSAPTPPMSISMPAMPSKPVATPAPAPSTTTMPPTAPRNMGPADMMLSQKTVEITPTKEKVPPAAAITTPPPPGAYKKDPYREPAE